MSEHITNTFTPGQEGWLETLELEGPAAYKQTTGNLRVEDQYCCLGVLCDITDPRQWSSARDYWGTEGCDVNPPDWLCNETDFRWPAGCPGAVGIALCVNLNDECSATFHEIARCIRELPGLFFHNFDWPGSPKTGLGDYGAPSSGTPDERTTS